VRVPTAREAVLERAQSLVDHGVALRRVGRPPRSSRSPGRAGRAARRGRGRSARASPRRHLAADGRSNREIAEELFVTRKAVEWHLRNAYVKLGIASRRELPAALKT
jgi:hypothetical protein